MKLPQFMKQSLYIRRFNQCVIMIRQDAPGERLIGVGTEHGQQIVAEILHSSGAFTDQMPMLKARGRNEETHVAKVGAVRW